MIPNAFRPVKSDSKKILPHEKPVAYGRCLSEPGAARRIDLPSP